MFTPADPATFEAARQRIFPSRGGIVLIWLLFGALVYILVDYASWSGSYLLLFVFAPPFLLGTLACTFYFSRWGARHRRLRAGKRLAEAASLDPLSACGLPAWTLLSDTFPQSRRFLKDAGLSEFERECALVLASELDPHDLVDVAGLLDRVRMLS